MNTCRYVRGTLDSYGQNWITYCGREVHCAILRELGDIVAALPIEGQRHFCPYCGRRIYLADRALQENTYDDWKAKGFQVNLGEKSGKRNAAGVAVFTEEQVSKIVKKMFPPKPIPPLPSKQDLYAFPNDDDIPF